MKVTADDVAQLLAEAPPRRVPRHVAKAARGTGGCALPLFGLIFFTLGMVFAVIFFPWRFWDDWRLADAPTTTGVIRDVRDANMTINEVKVAEYVFGYTPDGGTAREGRCFTTGREWSSGSAVTVHYLASDPDVACIDGARLSPGGWVGVFVIIFPLIGGGLLVWSIVHRRRTQWILRHGVTAEVDVVSVAETQTKVNDQPVYRIGIQAPALNNGQLITVKRVNRPDVALAFKHLEAKQPVFVLYDPAKPAHVLFPEALISPDV